MSSEDTALISPAHEGLKIPKMHEVLEQYYDRLDAIKKPSWLLLCEKQDEALNRVESHIGGCAPFVPDLDGWPMCQSCSRPLEFVWQLDFTDLTPIGFAKAGLFQFYYCWYCCPEPEDGPEKGYITRWYPGFRAPDALDLEHADCPYTPEEAAIGAQWKIKPRPYHSLPGIFSPDNPIPNRELDRYVSAEEGRLWNIYNNTEGLHLWNEMWSRAGGFAPWILYHDETPYCPKCGGLSEFVAAIGSEGSQINWGGAGYWYFFACRRTDKCLGLNQPLMSNQCL